MPNVVWTELERQYIRSNADKMSDEEGARTLSGIVRRKISVHAWRKQRQSLGIKKESGRGVCRIKEDSAKFLLREGVGIQSNEKEQERNHETDKPT